MSLFTVVEVKKEENEITYLEKKRAGLVRRKQPNKVDYILRIEKLWENYALQDRSEYALEKLLRELSFGIKKKAESYGRKCVNKRIFAADFESIFYEQAWKLCDTYEWYSENGFYFYETLELVFKRRAIDLIRSKTITKQGAFEVSILPFNEDAADYIANNDNVEKDITDRLLISKLLSEVSLTDEETRLLIAKYNNPYVSNTELARIAGFNHHQKVQRLFGKIRKKLESAGYSNCL